MGSLQSLWRTEDPHRMVELVLIVTRLAGLVGLLLLVLPPERPPPSSRSSWRSSGCCWGFLRPQPQGHAHRPEDLKLDFLHRQVLMSRNVRGASSWTPRWADSTTRSSTTCSRACRART